jgi:hypothetical protein
MYQLDLGKNKYFKNIKMIGQYRAGWQGIDMYEVTVRIHAGRPVSLGSHFSHSEEILR